MSANILTVDDSASIRLTTRIALTNAGYAVTGPSTVPMASTR